MSRTIMHTDPVPPLGREPETENNSSVDSHFPSPAAPGLAVIPPQVPSPEPCRESALAPFAEIFIGPKGFYPGARWIIYLAMVYFTFEVLSFLLAGFRSDPVSPWWRLAAELRMMLAAVLPAFFMARLEGRSFGDFGLPAKRAFRRDFWMGTVWGFGALTALILGLAALRAFSFGSLSLYGARILRYAIAYAIFFLIVSVFEDFLTRGYSLWVLSQGMHFWPAAALLSILFGLMHLLNPGEARIGIAAVVTIGFFFCLTLRRTGTLWFAIGFHMAWDWGETYFYSVPDSGTVLPRHLLNSSFHGPEWLTGGSVGPEGSYLLFVLIAVLWFLFSRAYPEVKYQATPSREGHDFS
ncbi:MAG: lysostaphin resistance A-like protein, partial [Terriglobales bacterium]